MGQSLIIYIAGLQFAAAISLHCSTHIITLAVSCTSFGVFSEVRNGWYPHQCYWP
jgi:hypothetical protein